MTALSTTEKDISFIFTLYNRGEEIRTTAQALTNVMKSTLSSIDYEIILCNDGSTDSTLEICHELEKEDNHIRVTGYEKNEGRGYAVKKSLECCLGKKIMYMDSDVSMTTDLRILKEVVLLLDSNPVIVGDRYHSFENLHRPWIRTVIGYGYRMLKILFFPKLNVSDCEAGFKAFRADILRPAASLCRENRWSFDLELLWILHLQNVPVYQIPLPWNEHHAHYKSSVNLFSDSVTQLLGFFRIRYRHKSGQVCKS